jgi:hypothetical protein
MEESCIGAFLLILLSQFYPCYYLALSFYSSTYWVPTISVLKLAIFLCYSNLLFRRRWWTGILRWDVLGYVLPWLLFLWHYGVFRCSVLLRVIIVFRDTTYVIIILYLWHLVICNTFGCMCGTVDPGSCIWWVHGFGIKTGYDRSFGLGSIGGPSLGGGSSMPRMEKPTWRYSRVEESLSNDPKFIKVEFNIGRFISAVVDTEADRVNMDVLYIDLESASTWFNVSIFRLTFCNHSCLVLTPLFI